MSKPIGVGIIGLGFMGRTHLAGYRFAAEQGCPCSVVALCDESSARIDDTFATMSVEHRARFAPDPARYQDVDTFLKAPAMDLVSICTHTDTHIDLAMRALQAGKHVLLEKPVAIRSAEVARLCGMAAKSDRICLPAMCMRFWPGWTWLRERVVDRRYGALQSAVFSRLGSAPHWTPFYADFSRSGGALFDLHIHDADFVRWLFGEPLEVTSTGSPTHLTTIFRFENAGHVVAEGGWLASGFPFRMRYIANFESATADFDSLRTQPLLVTHEALTVPVPTEPWTGWDAEIAHMLELVGGREQKPAVTLDDALAVTRILEAEAISLRTGRPVELRK